jgi:capsular polysaccharide biosynthesis protein
MELRQYWLILRRRWLLLVIPTIIILAAGLLTYQPPGTAYNVGVNFIVGQTPPTEAVTTDEQRYYRWLTSEYIVNGLVDWVKGTAYASLVSKELATQGIDIPAGAIRGSLAADNARSVMTLSLTWGDEAQLAAMMEAAITVLAEQNAGALPPAGSEPVIVTQLDEPVINAIPAGLQSQLDLPIRVVLALAAGIGLALLAEYLDPTLRSRADLETIELPVLGEIPKR